MQGNTRQRRAASWELRVLVGRDPVTGGREPAPWQRDALCREYPEVDFVPSTSGATAPAAGLPQIAIRSEPTAGLAG